MKALAALVSGRIMRVPAVNPAVASYQEEIP
jgi:hypothetical protein